LSDVRFSRKRLRDASSWGQTQLRVHLGRLVEMEYLAIYRGPRNQMLYQVCEYDGDLAGQNASWRGSSGPSAAPNPPGQTPDKAKKNATLENSDASWRAFPESTTGVSNSSAILS